MNTSKWNSKISWSYILTPRMCVCFSNPDLALTSCLCAVSFAKRLAQEFPMWQVIHNLWISFYGLEMTTKGCTCVWLFWGHRILKWLFSAVFLKISKLKHVSFLREGNIWVTVSISGFAVSWGVIFHMEARASFCGICSSWCSSACMWPSHLLIQHLNKTSSSK
jgi:hypothetical protein